MSQRAEICMSSASVVASRSTSGPLACWGERGVQRMAHNHDLTAIELAHTGGHDMDVHFLAATLPTRLHKVLLSQARQIVTELLPAPALRSGLVGHAQPAVALETSRDEKVSFASGMPQAFGAVPTGKLDVRFRACDWLELANEGFHHLNLALERHLCSFAHLGLTVQLRSQRTLAIQ